MASLSLFFPDRQRRPYYITAPPYSRYSAGNKVLHLLCHLLNMKGQSAFIVGSRVNPDLVAPLLSEQIVEEHYREKRTPIVVYPETLNGNPLEACCVVRYLLNIPGLLGVDGGFGADDMLVWYNEYYRSQCKGQGLILEIPTVDSRDFVPPPGGTKRDGGCFYAGKYKRFSDEELSPTTANCIEIPFGGDGITTQVEIAQLFQRSELFYAYEATALGLEAMLCGCPLVMLPSNFTPKPTNRAALNPAGVAWGTDPEEIAHAKATVSQVRGLYETSLETASVQLDEFIKLTQRMAATRSYSNKICLVDALAPVKPTLLRRYNNAFLRGCTKAAKALLGPRLSSKAFRCFKKIRAKCGLFPIPPGADSESLRRWQRGPGPSK